MKFALFFVCALVAVQGFQARSVEPSERDQNIIIEAIRQTIEKLREIIYNIISRISEIIENINVKIKEISGINQEIVNNVRDRIQDLIELGEKGKKCVELHRDQIEALINQVQDDHQGCIKDAENQAASIRNKVEVLISKIEELQIDVIYRVAKCIQGSGVNPIALVKCLRDQAVTIGEQVSEIQQEALNTVEVAKEIAQKVVVTLGECSQQVNQEVALKEEEILESIKGCIEQA